MDAEVPPQSCTGSKQARARAQKLRMSCDSCSSSKTKCDQTRPICLRCQKSGLKCNYSVSQRKGKPPAASRDPSAAIQGRKLVQEKQPSELKGSGTPTEDAQQAVGSMLQPDTDSPMMDFTMPVFDLWQEFIPDTSEYAPSDFNNTTPPDVFNTDLVSTDTSSVLHHNQLEVTNKSIFDFDDCIPDVLEMDLQSPPSMSESQIPRDQMPTPALSSSSSISSKYSSQRSNCARLASSTLDSLNIGSQPCRAAESPYRGARSPFVASFDQILNVNKSAMESVHQLLSCSCSLSQQSNLVLSLIIDKILCLYQSIIRNDVVSRDASPSSDGSARQTVRDTPITVGIYKMDAKTEQHMRLQLVSNELRKSAMLVEEYADRYNRLGCQDRENKDIYAGLTGLLKRRLKEASGDMTTELRKSRV